MIRTTGLAGELGLAFAVTALATVSCGSDPEDCSETRTCSSSGGSSTGGKGGTDGGAATGGTGGSKACSQDAECDEDG